MKPGLTQSIAVAIVQIMNEEGKELSLIEKTVACGVALSSLISQFPSKEGETTCVSLICDQLHSDIKKRRPE